MQAVYFPRSFLTFRVDTRKRAPETSTHKLVVSLNNARIQIENRLRITERATGRSEEFMLGANCKTERVGVDRDIWTEPNADFVPVMSEKQFLIVKTYDHIGQTVALYPRTRGVQSDRQVGLVEDAFDDVRIDLAWSEAEPLDTVEEVIQATLDNQPLAATTEIETGRYRVTLDYPVKTMNASERDSVFQTDTGPVLLPDFERDWAEMISGLELAFCAFNCPHWIEFIVRQPTPIGDGINVWHYSRPKRFDCKSRVLRLL